jgi:cytochrome c|tara:strand:- start:8269 stop:8730 length:462 start_codon:yes stop_codon:yes gene_type:complete
MNKSLKFTLITGATMAASLLTTFASADIYKLKCMACHQAGGVGIPNAFPPLAESEWVSGPAKNLIRIQLRGLMGPITVKGKQYNMAMPANAAMTDEEIASVLTYIRSNFGNKADAITAEMVKQHRGEVGKPMLTVKDLIDPLKAPATEKKEQP